MNTQDFKRKLTAVFSADVAGYSRLMGEDEAATVKTLEAYKQVMFSLIKQHRGRVVDSPGDNILAEFASVVDAVQCGVAVQKELEARNADLPENRRMQFRIGVNLGDVIEEEGRIYGDGVNIAARLEGLADPGGICVSKTAFDQIEMKLPLGYEYLGEQPVKNIAKAIGAYRVLMEPRVLAATQKSKKLGSSLFRQKKVIVGVIAVLVAIFCVGIWSFLPRRSSIEATSINTAALRLEIVQQGWNIIPAGTLITYKGKQASIRQDLVHADVIFRVTNTSPERILLPAWVLLDKNKEYLDPFRLTEADGKEYIKGDIIIGDRETRLIRLRCTAKSLKDLKKKEPLFIGDSAQNFIFPLSSIPDRATLLKNREDQINSQK